MELIQQRHVLILLHQLKMPAGAKLSEAILSQYREISEFYDIEYDEVKIQEGRDQCLEFFKQQRLNS